VRRDESGFTLVEIMVVSLVMTVIGAALLGLLTSMTANERAQSARAENGRAIRLAMADVLRDVRAADPLTGGDAARVELTIAPAQRVRWELAGGRLSRSLLDGTGAVITRASPRSTSPIARAPSA
jgi:type II secretory pathway pseudopilin PulG